MKFIAAVHSDVGILKKINQDSLCLEIAETKRGQVAMGVICDGMGGEQKGELASAVVIREFHAWFEQRLPGIVKRQLEFRQIKAQWQDMVQQANKKLLRYGGEKLKLGTTLTGILIIEGRFLIIHVGDSRVYHISNRIVQLTKDQTYAAREIERRHLTGKQAENVEGDNVLLQSIGVSEVLEPVFTEGRMQQKEAMLLCSDGFRHKISSEEMLGVLSPRILPNEMTIKKSLVDLVELNKSRKETDNISAMLIKAV